MAKQREQFANSPAGPDPVDPAATVHDILRSKGGSTSRGGVRHSTLAEAGRRAPVSDRRPGARGPRILDGRSGNSRGPRDHGVQEGAAGYVY